MTDVGTGTPVVSDGLWAFSVTDRSAAAFEGAVSSLSQLACKLSLAGVSTAAQTARSVERDISGSA